MPEVRIELLTSRNELPQIVPLKIAYDRELKRNHNLSPEDALGMLHEFWDFGSDFYVAKSDKEIIGYAVGLEDEGFYEGECIYVVNDWRGKNVATRLEESVITHAKSLGCKEIWSSVSNGNLPSIALQKKIGANIEDDFTGYSKVSLKIS